MKYHAFLLQVHTCPQLTKMIIERLQSDNHYFFIHVDKKCKDYEDFLKLACENVLFTKGRYNVKWGSYEQIALTLELLREALQVDVSFSYFHLISGQDYPILNSRELDVFFENRTASYMELDRITPIYDRYMFYRLNSLVNLKSRIGNILDRIFLNLQKGISYVRDDVDIKTYKGCNWWSLNNEAVNYIILFLKNNPNYIKRFKHTSCCDEVFFHTILFNSPLVNNIICNSLRYVDWNKRKDDDLLPRILDIEDFNRLLYSENIFCRKVSLEISLSLINKINEYSFDCQNE